MPLRLSRLQVRRKRKTTGVAIPRLKRLLRRGCSRESALHDHSFRSQRAQMMVILCLRHRLSTLKRTRTWQGILLRVNRPSNTTELSTFKRRVCFETTLCAAGVQYTYCTRIHVSSSSLVGEHSTHRPCLQSVQRKTTAISATPLRDATAVCREPSVSFSQRIFFKFCGAATRSWDPSLLQPCLTPLSRNTSTTP